MMLLKVVLQVLYSNTKIFLPKELIDFEYAKFSTTLIKLFNKISKNTFESSFGCKNIKSESKKRAHVQNLAISKKSAFFILSS